MHQKLSCSCTKDKGHKAYLCTRTPILRIPRAMLEPSASGLSPSISAF